MHNLEVGFAVQLPLPAIRVGYPLSIGLSFHV